MTHEKKIDFMRIASGICGFGIPYKELDLLVSIYELVIEKQGEATLMDALKVQEDVKSRDDAKKKSELLDKIS